MFDDADGQDLFGMSSALDALQELGQNTDQAILMQRSSERLEIQVHIHVQPSNSSQRHQFTIEGVTADISNGGCMALLSRPLLAGDLFWLSFDETLPVGSLFSRCMRCRMVREDAFEVGFRFMNDIDLRSSVSAAQQTTV